jgi:lipopolysaccharide/colanic/teichoic acid biosynthesis glycosyltransferase
MLSMNLIIIHKNEDHKDGKSKNLLRFALAHEPMGGLLLDGISKYIPGSMKDSLSYTHSKHNSADIIYAVPDQWDIAPDVLMKKTVIPQKCPDDMIRYSENIQITSDIINRIESRKSPESWLVVSNGRFATQINNELFVSIPANIRADIVAVNADPELLNKREKIQLTKDNKIAGFRRLYSDSTEFAPEPDDWPHHLFIKNHIFVKIFKDSVLPESFSSFVSKCRSNAFIIRTIKVGGTALDLETEGGLLEFYKTELETSGESALGLQKSNAIPENSRCVGKVLLCNDLQLGQNVTIVGPAIICNNVHIGHGAVINSSIIGPDVHVPQNRLVNNTILTETQHNENTSIGGYEKTFVSGQDINTFKNTDMTYRNWPKFSYVRCIKRIADCILAVIVLILFAPLIPFIALAIKLSSPGPVFFKDKRQGLHGQEFNCLKFRTMIVGAEKIQEKLKSVSHVDGPQFKIVNDPRLSAVGTFLRETYIDEIPQFINVLLGQMSVVGPRPSPESENTLCPYWRDARLSVRPGITGLWQIYRTRVPMKDFQEWILYDTEYVRNLSLKMDMSICWKTTKKLFEEFINQF